MGPAASLGTAMATGVAGANADDAAGTDAMSSPYEAMLLLNHPPAAAAPPKAAPSPVGSS